MRLPVPPLPGSPSNSDYGLILLTPDPRTPLVARAAPSSSPGVVITQRFAANRLPTEVQRLSAPPEDRAPETTNGLTARWQGRTAILSDDVSTGGIGLDAARAWIMTSDGQTTGLSHVVLSNRGWGPAGVGITAEGTVGVLRFLQDGSVTMATPGALARPLARSVRAGVCGPAARGDFVTRVYTAMGAQDRADRVEVHYALERDALCLRLIRGAHWLAWPEDDGVHGLRGGQHRATALRCATP